MNLVVMQPSYIPWLGYFDLMLKADLFLYYDNVQFDKDSWRNRNRIKTPQGAQWLTVPVLTKGLNKPTNGEIQINNNENWKKKHLKSIELNYRKSRFFEQVFPKFETILNQEWDKLIDLNAAFIKEMSSMLGIETTVDYVSNLKLELPDDKNEKLIAICKKVGANQFYEPKGGATYIDGEMFKSRDIQLEMQDFQFPTYPQLFGEFISQLSTIDLLFNLGPEGSREIFLNACKVSS